MYLSHVCYIRIRATTTMKLCQVEDQYKKFPAIKRDEVKKLMEWCQKQAHLPRNITGDNERLVFDSTIIKRRTLFLLSLELEVILFLHSNYNKVEATKVTIDNYYTCRTHMTMFFGSRDIKGADMVVAHDLL